MTRYYPDSRTIAQTIRDECPARAYLRKRRAIRRRYERIELAVAWAALAIGFFSFLGVLFAPYLP